MKITEGYLVVFKAVLYFLVAFLTPFSGLLATSADANTQNWPTALQITSSLMVGLLSGLVALRAYFDGSNERWTDRQNGSFRIVAKPNPQPETHP